MKRTSHELFRLFLFFGLSYQHYHILLDANTEDVSGDYAQTVWSESKGFDTNMSAKQQEGYAGTEPLMNVEKYMQHDGDDNTSSNMELRQHHVQTFSVYDEQLKWDPPAVPKQSLVSNNNNHNEPEPTVVTQQQQQPVRATDNNGGMVLRDHSIRGFSVYDEQLDLRGPRKVDIGSGAPVRTMEFVTKDKITDELIEPNSPYTFLRKPRIEGFTVYDDELKPTPSPRASSSAAGKEESSSSTRSVNYMEKDYNTDELIDPTSPYTFLRKARNEGYTVWDDMLQL